MKHALTIAALLIVMSGKTQTCDCEKEFTNIRTTIEKNFSGFADNLKLLTEKAYRKKVEELTKLTHNRFGSDNCILIIEKYLDLFKSHHLGFSFASDPYKTDTAFVNQRPRFNFTDEQMARLKASKSWEGIYIFIHDSSTKVAVIKDPTPLHDYIGVTLESTRSTWKKGMIKFEGKLKNDSLMTGLLYMRNHRPKLEGFQLWDENNMIGGDWRREGSPPQKKAQAASGPAVERMPTIFAKSLTPNSFYLKMGSFDLDYKPVIDSIMKVNEALLNSTPNLVLDLRDNGGGADMCWAPLIPYFYTNPIKTVGNDILATETTISLYKKYLDDKNLSKEDIEDLNKQIAKMEKAKGQWMNHFADQTDSSYQRKPFPKKIVILINRWCGSSTEELLLAAKQSSKVVLAGENTIGNLDYSNVVSMPFSCFPYTLYYPTTRSRRLNIHQGIDNVGIAPTYRLNEKDDWIKEALKIAEQQP